jgi:hypothetical protein
MCPITKIEKRNFTGFEPTGKKSYGAFETNDCNIQIPMG